MDKFLPIGTVCSFKNKKKKVVIIGYCCVPKNNNDLMYDYCVCLYPEGNFSFDKTILVNHDQIDKIYYMGYKDDEFADFVNKLKNMV